MDTKAHDLRRRDVNDCLRKLNGTGNKKLVRETQFTIYISAISISLDWNFLLAIKHSRVQDLRRGKK